MQTTRVLMQQRQPMIRFLGKRQLPSHIDHTPKAHPAAPSHSLPDSFASYRQKAQQHGPLGGRQFASAAGQHHGRSGHSLGPVKAAPGEYFDRNELPARFRRKPFSVEEIEAVDSAGASLFA